MAEDNDKNIRLKRPDYLDLKDVRDNNDLSSYSSAVRFLVDHWRGNRPLPAVSTDPVSLTSETDEDASGSDTGSAQSDESVVAVDVVDVESQSPLMVLEDLTIPDVDVYCPVCLTELCSLRLDENVPLVETGTFREFTIPCTDCGTERFAYQLVAIDKDLDVPVEAVADKVEEGLPRYWDNTWEKDKAKESVGMRAQRCAQIAKETGWDWRPPLGPWSQAPEASAETIMQDLRSIVQSNTPTRVTLVEPADETNTHDEWLFRVTPADSATQPVADLGERVVDVLEDWANESKIELTKTSLEEESVAIVFDGASAILAENE